MARKTITKDRIIEIVDLIISEITHNLEILKNGEGPHAIFPLNICAALFDLRSIQYAISHAEYCSALSRFQCEYLRQFGKQANLSDFWWPIAGHYDDIAKSRLDFLNEYKKSL